MNFSVSSSVSENKNKKDKKNRHVPGLTKSMIKWIAEANSVTYGFRVTKAKSKKWKRVERRLVPVSVLLILISLWLDDSTGLDDSIELSFPYSLVWFEWVDKSTTVANSDSRHRTVQYSTQLLWKLERKLDYLQNQTRDGWKWNQNIPFDNVRSTLSLDHSDISN